MLEQLKQQPSTCPVLTGKEEVPHQLLPQPYGSSKSLQRLWTCNIPSMF